MSGVLLPARYSELTHLASGGMGDVYRAEDGVLGRTVAVKLLAERHARDGEVRARFTREARAAARLSAHPNVVTVFDVGEIDGRPFIVMAYLDGGSVHDRLRVSTVSPGQALAWLEQAARALDSAHAQGIVHRDVKPANLLLDSEGRVHVTDFGIASAAGHDTLTLPGTVLGTTGYLSPEGARGDPATPASDRYALGVVAFELLTGARPYQSETPVTEAFAHLNAEIPSAREAAPELPRGIDAVFDRALAKDPGDRPASAGELVEELRDAFRADEEATAVIAPPAAAPAPAPVPAAAAPPPARRARRRWLVPVALLGLLVSGVAAAAIVADDEAPPETRTRTVITTISDSASTLTVTETATLSVEDETMPPPPETQAGSAEELNDEGYRLMQARDYDEALPLLEDAVARLAGTGSLTEAFASYNLAFTRFALGNCDGVLELLDRSEVAQGERKDIDRLRRKAERACEGDRGGGDEGDD